MQCGLCVSDATEHAEQDASERNDARFHEPGTPHHATRPPHGQQQADLRGATLQREQKQQRREHQRRRDEEHAQTNEQPAEVHAALCRRTGIGFEITRHEADVGEVQPQRQHVGLRFGSLAFIRHADGGEIAKTIGPELLPGGKTDKPLRRAFELVPVFLVLVTDGLHVHRDARLPVTAVVHVGHTGKLRRPGLRDHRMIHRQDARHFEFGRLLLQFTPQADDEVFHLEFAADDELLIVRQPLGDGDLILLAVADGGHHRVRCATLRGGDAVHQISQHTTGAFELENPLRHAAVQKHAAGAEFPLFGLARDAGELQREVFQRALPLKLRA